MSHAEPDYDTAEESAPLQPQMVLDVRGMRSLMKLFGEEVIRKMRSDLTAARQPVSTDIARVAEMFWNLDSKVNTVLYVSQMVLGSLKRQNPKQGGVAYWISKYFMPHYFLMPTLSHLSNVIRFTALSTAWSGPEVLLERRG